MSRRLRLAAGAATTGLAASVFAPAPAIAHGLVGRSDLPIPDWMFTWGAALILIVSFLVLAIAWPTPRLQQTGFSPLPKAIGRVLTSPLVEALCGSVGVALLVLVVYSGYAGVDSPNANFAPNFVYVAFWLGLVPLSVLFGDVFRAFNPWRAIGRTVGGSVRRVALNPPAPLPYPRRLGYWPAAFGLLGFGWLELVATKGDRPGTVAAATLVYSAITLMGMAVWGVERWSDRGEAFSVYFGLFSRISVFERRGREVGLRKPFAALAQWPAAPGAVALLAVMIGVVSFDGLSAGAPWNDATAGVLRFLRDDVGLSAPGAITALFGFAMFAVVLIIAGLYWLGIAGARTTDFSRTYRELGWSFAHTLVPIALAYVAAHYVSLLLLQGQALGYLASDPLGDGSNLFGTATWTINYGFLGATTFWYLQVGFVVAGHVAALALAHDRALAMFDDPKAAVRSQYWLLGVMVCYTTLALWLLAQAREG